VFIACCPYVNDDVVVAGRRVWHGRGYGIEIGERIEAEGREGEVEGGGGEGEERVGWNFFPFFRGSQMGILLTSVCLSRQGGGARSGERTGAADGTARLAAVQLPCRAGRRAASEEQRWGE
jgi:hypothetical protein